MGELKGGESQNIEGEMGVMQVYMYVLAWFEGGTQDCFRENLGGYAIFFRDYLKTTPLPIRNEWSLR